MVTQFQSTQLGQHVTPVLELLTYINFASFHPKPLGHSGQSVGQVRPRDIEGYLVSTLWLWLTSFVTVDGSIVAFASGLNTGHNMRPSFCEDQRVIDIGPQPRADRSHLSNAGPTLNSQRPFGLWYTELRRIR